MRLFPLLLLAAPLFAERITVPLRDPSRPALVKVNTINGSIHVKTHGGKDVLVETEDSPPRTQPAPNGMRQILTGGGGINIEEENNVVTIKPQHGNGSYVVVVPEKSSLHLKSINAKEIRIEGVEGEINAETVNGSIIITDASGPVVAHALNGRLTATLKQIPAGKPMSFSTLNGRIDLTLPSGAKADFTINNQRGETYSDFDFALKMTTSREESGRDNGPKYRLNLNRSLSGQINGGGPEISIRSMNGTIYIRKAK
ncbi:MAG TPA: hypothetical protein VFQ91_07405 [Bryobacteraceae bacterium]|nr:hypothetical protein [Bryobacteraceae bacterium]